MIGIRIYIEGGGDSDDQKAELRDGFKVFLKELQDKVRAKRLKWNVVLCGSREATFDHFKAALRKYPDSLNILLVDAESAVAVIGEPWSHLTQQDKWQDPGVGDNSCHLMTQSVEAWLIADPDAIARYYGEGFRPKLLPRNPNVEDIPQVRLSKALEQASTQTKKGKYNKIRH